MTDPEVEAVARVATEIVATLHLRKRDGWLIVTSPDHRGLYVASKDHTKAMADVLPALEGLTALDDARRKETK